MFRGCKNLEKLDVSYLNTINSKSFRSMFYECSKLKEINVSKFKTTNCENISCMISCCSSLESIDMLNWDMKNINNIDYLFKYCSKLNNIKMNFNYNDYIDKLDKLDKLGFFVKVNRRYGFGGVFEGLPKIGSFVWKKGSNYNEILQHLPATWNRTEG